MNIGRVLSLAGGGTWALIEVKALMALYPGLGGHEILDQFDIAIGNSGGAIVLAGLAADMAPKDILGFFLNQSDIHQLYTPTSGIEAIFSRLGLAPKWLSAAKLAALKAIYGTPGGFPLNQFENHIALCAYDLDRNREVIFRSYPSPIDDDPFVATLAEAAHASSSAPILYFDAPAVITNQRKSTDVRRFWDGGLGSYNLPVRAGISEAFALGCDHLSVLSLSCGLKWLPLGTGDLVHTPRAGDDLVGALKTVARDCITAPAVSALTDTYFTPNIRLVHLSPYLAPIEVDGNWVIPPAFLKDFSETDWKTLTTADMDITDANTITLLDRYTDAWIAGTIPNEPIILDPLNGTLVIGQRSFAEGRDLWNQSAHIAPTA